MSYFSQKIKSLRLANNYSQKEVAEGVGISQGTYSGLESGKNDPSLTTLQKLADFYDESIDCLVQPFRVVDDSELTDEEKILMKKFRRLSTGDQVEIKYLIDLKINNARETRKQEERGNEE